jgi:hypothetical protein
VDKTVTNAFYEIEIEPETTLPVRISLTVLTGTRGGATDKDGKKITGGRHVAFHFVYSLSEFEKLEAPQIPPEAQKLLTKL